MLLLVVHKKQQQPGSLKFSSKGWYDIMEDSSCWTTQLHSFMRLIYGLVVLKTGSHQATVISSKK